MATRLTDAKLKALAKPGPVQVEVADSEVRGLRARVGISGSISFVLRKRVGDRIKNITLGRFGPRFGTVEARRKARSLLSDLEAGKALPLPKGRGESALTIRALVPQYLAAKAQLRSAIEIERILNREVVTVLGDRLADTVTRGEVTRLIDEIAERAPTMARAVHAQLSAFYTWALPRLDRLPANPCRDAGRPAKAKARDRVLSDPELAALWKVAEGEALPWGAGLKLLILTGARREEVFSADRSEFDLKAKVWTIPAERAKNGVAHILPLSAPALVVLRGIPEIEGSAKLFPTRTVARQAEAGPSGFSKAQSRIRLALDQTLKREEGPHWRLHDIRRTVATGLQRLGIRFEVTEARLEDRKAPRARCLGAALD